MFLLDHGCVWRLQVHDRFACADIVAMATRRRRALKESCDSHRVPVSSVGVTKNPSLDISADTSRFVIGDEDCNE